MTYSNIENMISHIEYKVGRIEETLWRIEFNTTPKSIDFSLNGVTKKDKFIEEG